MSCSCSTAQRYNLELIDVIKHNDETYSFDFKNDQLRNWSEGDSSKVYVNVGFSEVGKKFSYATLPDESIIRFTTRIKEERSAYKDALSLLKVGDNLEVSEPSGDFKLKRDGRPILLLSNGVGIAATRSLVKSYEMDQEGIPGLAQLNVDATGQIYKNEFDEIVMEGKRFESHYASNRDDFYNKLDFELQNIMSKYDDPYVYVVGSHAFVSGCIAHLEDVGIDSEDIVTDGFDINGGGCGCSSNEGCGCGANLVSNIVTSDKFVFPTSKKQAS